MHVTRMLDRIDRRAFSNALAAAGLSLVAMPLLRRPARAENGATLFTWAGYDRPDLFAAYADTYGGPPAITIFGQEEEALQKLRAGFAADVLHPCTYSVSRWRDADVIQPVDTGRLAHWGDLFDRLTTVEGTVFDGQHYLVPFDWGNASVVYRTDIVGEKYQEENSWEILYDPEYKGRLAMFDGETAAVGVAALVLGYDNPWSLSDEQLAEVQELMRKQRDLLRFYWTSQTEVQQAMASGEVVAAYAWNDAVVELKQQGVPVDYMNPKEGIFTWVCGLALHSEPPGSLDAAYALIDSMTSPDSGEILIQEFGLGHSNRKAFERVPAERLEELAISSPEALFERGVFLKEVEPELKAKYIATLEQVQAGI
ncbi:extracellular solute-binding protein [Rhodospirillaceae bacterium SYSU D60014]|uniref:ABC transporter substrate-binding protein n=1 Tax=Virgifigura deserti TaxID=2268457 RepID=UPI000E66329D